MTRFREPFAIVSVEDVDRAAAFYCSTFGFERTYSFEDGGSTAFAFLQLEPHGLGLARRAEDDDPGLALWLYADDVDEAAAALRDAGAEEVLPPTDRAWGERMCTFRGPDGTTIHVGMRR